MLIEKEKHKRKGDKENTKGGCTKKKSIQKNLLIQFEQQKSVRSSHESNSKQ